MEVTGRPVSLHFPSPLTSPSSGCWGRVVLVLLTSVTLPQRELLIGCSAGPRDKGGLTQGSSQLFPPPFQREGVTSGASS